MRSSKSPAPAGIGKSEAYRELQRERGKVASRSDALLSPALTRSYR